MTERRPAKHRLSKRWLRAWAWIAALASFVVPMRAIAAKPETEEQAMRSRPVIKETLIRRIVLVPQPTTSEPRIVYVGSTGGSAGTAPPPPTTSGGSGLP